MKQRNKYAKCAKPMLQTNDYSNATANTSLICATL